MVEAIGEVKLIPGKAPAGEIIIPLEEKPEIAEKVIRIELVPEEVTPYIPPEKFYPTAPTEYESYVAPKPEKKPLVIDIETTGEDPTRSRLICIGVLDPNEAEPRPAVIMMGDEKEMLTEFLSFYHEMGYNEIIGYNLKFDFRYIFARCSLYRIPAKEFFDSELRDVMQIYAQVKEAFVYGINKPYKLADWGRLLFGMKKPMNYKELLEAYEKGEWEKIIAYNENDVIMTYQLWALSQYILRVPGPAPIGEGEASNTADVQPEASSATLLKCPACLAEWPLTQEVCDICKRKLR